MQARDGRVNGPPQPGRQRPDARQKAAERAAEMAAPKLMQYLQSRACGGVRQLAGGDWAVPRADPRAVTPPRAVPSEVAIWGARPAAGAAPRTPPGQQAAAGRRSPWHPPPGLSSHPDVGAFDPHPERALMPMSRPESRTTPLSTPHGTPTRPSPPRMAPWDGYL